MLIRIFYLLTITGLFQVQCFVPVPSVYPKVEASLIRYSSNMDHNPIVHSLLNVLVYNKQAKAFITDMAIEKSLEDIKKFNENDELILRKFIYGRKKLLQNKPVSTDLKDNIESALDVFFSHSNVDDYQTFDILYGKKKS